MYGDEFLIFFPMIAMVFFLVFILLSTATTDDSVKHQHTRDSISCVKAGGTWNTTKSICENK